MSELHPTLKSKCHDAKVRVETEEVAENFTSTKLVCSKCDKTCTAHISGEVDVEKHNEAEAK